MKTFESVTLMDDEFAPLTSTIGFVRGSLSIVSKTLANWWKELYPAVASKRIDGGIRETIGALEPLGIGFSFRALVIQTAHPEWVAVLDSSVGGTDATPVVMLQRMLSTDALLVTSAPQGGVSGALGSRQFHLFSPGGDSLGYLRSIDLVNEGDNWTFERHGTVQAFEDVEQYVKRRKVDRFTSEMLVRYCSSLGLRPFDEDFYTGPAVLVENSANLGRVRQMTLEMSQDYLRDMGANA